MSGHTTAVLDRPRAKIRLDISPADLRRIPPILSPTHLGAAQFEGVLSHRDISEVLRRIEDEIDPRAFTHEIELDVVPATNAKRTGLSYNADVVDAPIMHELKEAFRRDIYMPLREMVELRPAHLGSPRISRYEQIYRAMPEHQDEDVANLIFVLTLSGARDVTVSNYRHNGRATETIPQVLGSLNVMRADTWHSVRSNEAGTIYILRDRAASSQ